MKQPALQTMLNNIAFYSLFQTVRRMLMITIGSVLAALGYSLFQVPFNIAAGGLFGLGIIVNHFTGWPVGIFFLVANIPLMILGFRHLGRWAFFLYTLLSVIVFAVAADLFLIFVPDLVEPYPITDDMLLSAIYAGLVFGVGNGLIYRANGTAGGTIIVGRIIQLKTGFPLSQAYLYVDGTIIALAGMVFGWEIALHALLTLFISGMATDFVIEGSSFVRTVTIITDMPGEVARGLMAGLKRGASHWNITGGYTGQTHSMVWCTIYRSQVEEIKQIVSAIDPGAFIVVGMAHQAFGGGFLSLKGKRKEPSS
jgi:uncharacterized membrane-anchored protein YitT (DUF2179 family)